MSKLVDQAKSLLKATKEIPFNLKATEIYNKEISTNLKNLRKARSDKFWNSFSVSDDTDSFTKLIKDQELSELNSKIKNYEEQIKHLRKIRKPHIKELSRGFAIPLATTGTLAVGIHAAQNKNKKNEEIEMSKAAELYNELQKNAGALGVGAKIVGEKLLKGVKGYGTNVKMDSMDLFTGLKNLKRIGKNTISNSQLISHSTEQALRGAKGLGKRVGLPLLGAYVLGKD